MAELRNHETDEGDPLNIILFYPLRGSAESSALRFGARVGGDAVPVRTTFGPSQLPFAAPRSYAQKPFVKTGLSALHLTPGLAFLGRLVFPACLGPLIAETVLRSRNAAPSLGERRGERALRPRLRAPPETPARPGLRLRVHIAPTLELSPALLPLPRPAPSSALPSCLTVRPGP